MNKEEPTRISSLSGFVEWVNQLGSEKYLFRGVPNKEYKIQASAYRRLRENAGNLEFLQINKDLIADARLQGHGEKDGRVLGDLEILAQLQHFGAATCLIDFTRNAQVALYFACQKDLKWEKRAQDSENAPDGKVYAVSNDKKRFEKITSDSLRKSIDKFLQIDESDIPQLYCWEPGYQNNRIIAQQSIFVFGTYEFDETDTCIISKCSKKKILIELEQVSGINEAMLFPDFDGFARLHREDIPYTEPGAGEYMRFALQACLVRQPKVFEAYFNAVLRRDPTYSYPSYISQGMEKYSHGQYHEVIVDANKIIELDPNLWFGYNLRGRARERLGELEKAKEDFQKVLTLFTRAQRNDYTKIINDLEAAIQRIEKSLAKRNA